MKKSLLAALALLFVPVLFALPTPKNKARTVASITIRGGSFKIQAVTDGPCFESGGYRQEIYLRSSKGNIYLSSADFHPPYLQLNTPDYTAYQALWDSRWANQAPDNRKMYWELNSSGPQPFGVFVRRFPLEQLLQWSWGK